MTAAATDRLAALVLQRSSFLRYVSSRLAQKESAEDVLQEAYLRASTRLHQVREDGALLGWFYRVLDNAVRDRLRRQVAAARAIERYAHEPDEREDEATRRPCACVARLARGLKPEYAAALQRMEVDEVPVKAFATELAIKPTTAGVRVYRARRALRAAVESTCGACAAEGCHDCSCEA